MMNHDSRTFYMLLYLCMSGLAANTYITFRLLWVIYEDVEAWVEKRRIARHRPR